MSSKLNWERCKAQGRTTEPNYRPGTVLPNGVVVTGPRKDNLAYRADRAMRAWKRKLSPQDRQKLTGAN